MQRDTNCSDKGLPHQLGAMPLPGPLVHCSSGTLHDVHLACMSHMLLPDTVSEKNTRGKLRSAVERGLSQKQVVILDSLNNIKVGNSLLKTATVCF